MHMGPGLNVGFVVGGGVQDCQLCQQNVLQIPLTQKQFVDV